MGASLDERARADQLLSRLASAATFGEMPLALAVECSDGGLECAWNTASVFAMLRLLDVLDPRATVMAACACARAALPRAADADDLRWSLDALEQWRSPASAAAALRTLDAIMDRSRNRRDNRSFLRTWIVALLFAVHARAVALDVLPSGTQKRDRDGVLVIIVGTVCQTASWKDPSFLEEAASAVRRKVACPSFEAVMAVARARNTET